MKIPGSGSREERERWEPIHALLVTMAPKDPADLEAFFEEVDYYVGCTKADIEEWFTIPLKGWD